MSTYTRTVTVGQDLATARSAAEAVAANLRADGASVTLGEPYQNVTVKNYGMASCDISVTEPDVLTDIDEIIADRRSEAVADMNAAVMFAPSEPAGPETAAAEGEPVAAPPATTAMNEDDRAEIVEAMARDAATEDNVFGNNTDTTEGPVADTVLAETPKPRKKNR